MSNKDEKMPARRQTEKRAEGKLEWDDELHAGVFEGYVDGEPLVKWRDRSDMSQPGAKLYVGAAPVAAPTVQAPVQTAAEWISVDERLPSQDVEVLVYRPNNGDPRIEMDTWGDLYECPVDFLTISICTGQGWASNEFEDITHWMLLPPAPGEQVAHVPTASEDGSAKLSVAQMDRTQLQVEVFRLRMQAARAGYTWAPVEPTEAMIHAAEDLPAPRMFGKVYRTMLEAAPQPGQQVVNLQSADEVRAQALQEAASICDSVNNYDNPMTAGDCADAIRALAGQQVAQGEKGGES